MRTINYHLKLFFGVTTIWLFLAGFLTLQMWPDLPKTNLGWFLLIVAGPPVYVLGEGLFEWLFSEAHGKKVSANRFSAVRILLVLFVTLVILGVAALVEFILWQ